MENAYYLLSKIVLEDRLYSQIQDAVNFIETNGAIDSSAFQSLVLRSLLSMTRTHEQHVDE